MWLVNYTQVGSKKTQECRKRVGNVDRQTKSIRNHVVAIFSFLIYWLPTQIPTALFYIVRTFN